MASALLLDEFKKKKKGAFVTVVRLPTSLVVLPVAPPGGGVGIVVCAPFPLLTLVAVSRYIQISSTPSQHLQLSRVTSRFIHLDCSDLKSGFLGFRDIIGLCKDK